jgi:hypothetical protein
MSIEGHAPTLSIGAGVSDTPITPQTGALYFGDASEPASASLALTGYAPGLLTARLTDTGTLTLTGSAPTVSSLTSSKSWYLANATSDPVYVLDESGSPILNEVGDPILAEDQTNAGWRVLSESLQPAAIINDGWVVATDAVNTSAYAVGVERASTTFADALQPDGTLDTVLKDAFRTSSPYLGTFAAGDWDAHFVVSAVSSATGQDGRIRFRLLKADADGSNATEITSGQQFCSLLTNVTTAAHDSSLTFNPGAFSITNQYLFFQIAWERTGGATLAAADINWRTGSAITAGTRINTSSFTDGDTSLTIVPNVAADLVLTGLAPSLSESAGSAPVSLTPNAGELLLGEIEGLTPGTGALVLQGRAPVFSPEIQPLVGALTLEGQNAGFNQAACTPGTATLKCMQWVKIEWDANTEPDLAGYIVYRSLDGVAVAESRNVPGGTGALSYVWEGLPYGTNYFWVQAYDTSDNESAPSSTVSTFTSGGGWAPTLYRSLPITVPAVEHSITGHTPTLIEIAPPQTSIAPFTGELTFTGIPPTPGESFVLIPSDGALTVTEFAPLAKQSTDTFLTPVRASLTLNGLAPSTSISNEQVLTPITGALTEIGIVPNFAIGIVPSTGSLAFDGRRPVMNQDVFIGTANELTLDGQPGTTLDYAILTQEGSLTFTDLASSLHLALTVQPGALVIESDEPLLQVPGNTSVAPSRAQLIATGQQPTQGLSLETDTGQLDLVGQASTTTGITPGTATLTIGPASPGAFPKVRVTPLPCYPRWSRSNTWGGHSWCSHRRVQPYRTNQLNKLVYYLQVEIDQSSSADFVIAQITPILNVNAQIPDKYQAFVDEDGFERLSVEIISGSSDDFVIQSIRPVMNLKKQRRHS